MDTTFGNTVLNEALIRFTAKKSGVHTIQFPKGDDNVVLEISGNGSFDPKWLERLGFEVKIREVPTVCQADFCSGFYLPVLRQGETVYKHVRVPWKVIRHTPWNLGQLGFRASRQRFREKAFVELLANHGTPVLGALCRHWQRSAGALGCGHEFSADDKVKIAYHMPERKCGIPECTPEGRTLFAARYGVSIDDQLQCEYYLDSLLPGVNPDHIVLQRLAALQ